METISVANQKGGVGKTTLVVNLAAALARTGRRVLVVDMDFQANATAALVGRLPADAPTMAHALVGNVKVEDVLLETTTPNVVLAPGSETLSSADLTLAGKTGRELFLRRALAPVAGHFDLALIDTSPYLGLLTVNSLVASTKVLVPVSAEFFSMLGLQLLGENVEQVRQLQEQIGTPLEVLGYVVTLFDRRLGLTEEVMSQLRARFGSLLFESKVRINANLKVAPAHQKDVFAYESKTKKPWKGSEDFAGIAAELLERIGLPIKKAAA